MMINHGISGNKNFRVSSDKAILLSSATYFYQKQQALPETGKIGRNIFTQTYQGLNTNTLKLPDFFRLKYWQDFKYSNISMPALYCALLSILTASGMAIYSQFINLSTIKLEMAGQLILISLWAAIVAGVIIVLKALKSWRLQQHYAPLKPVVLQVWNQLDELNAYIERIQKTCQTSEKPVPATLMKCLDNYYEKTICFNKELQKIKLFIDDKQFDQLLDQYQAISKAFRDQLTRLIALLSDQPYETNPCNLVLQNLVPLYLSLDQYHQAIAKQLIQIIRY
ncbi:hypothetical protein [Alkanindiges illinoisensis]|uniref:hypothetical protein n=1 Tax=Alkanindiges illinoisensis TaxID=197183 RepID=UPI00047EC955|nr:hypothetical protein [Alkanindiges illinoisensis]